MTQEHPITPPPALVQRWIMEATEPSYVPTQAARCDKQIDTFGDAPETVHPEDIGIILEPGDDD